jgi:hypothetical protein
MGRTGEGAMSSTMGKRLDVKGLDVVADCVRYGSSSSQRIGVIARVRGRRGMLLAKKIKKSKWLKITKRSAGVCFIYIRYGPIRPPCGKSLYP